VARIAFAVPRRLLLTSVLVIASAGSFALRGSLFDVQMVFVFGILGFLMIRFGFPTVPLLIGFILTPLLEENLRTVLLLASTYDENIMFVFTRPAFNVLIFLIAIIIALITLRKIKNRRVPPSPTNK
jgi:putative tricarboxylic transport membrane protein